MIDYNGAMKRPFSDWRKLSIGALLYLIPVLNIITGLFASGYTFGCAKKKGKLPKWKDGKSLFVKGLLGTIISLLYFLPVLIIGFLLFYLFGGPELFQGLVNIKQLMPAIVVCGILLILLTYIMPMVMLHYINKFKFKDGFNFSSVFNKAFTRKYFVPWIFCMAYAIVIGVVITLIGSIFEKTIVIPLILNAYLSITIGITLMTVYGDIWREVK